MHLQDIYRRNASLAAVTFIAKSSQDLSLDVRRSSEIDGRQYEREKIAQEVLIDKLIQMEPAAIVFPALSCLPTCFDLRKLLPSIFLSDDDRECILRQVFQKHYYFIIST